MASESGHAFRSVVHGTEIPGSEAEAAMEDLRKQANDLLVFYGKMQNRLSQAGVSDTGSLVTMFKQLERGLEAVALEELDPALQEVSRLVDSLNRMQADLQVLRDLKLRVEKTKLALNGNGRSDEATGPLSNGRRAA